MKKTKKDSSSQKINKLKNPRKKKNNKHLKKGGNKSHSYNKKGGFLFNLFETKEDDSYKYMGKHMGSAINSENILITRYEQYVKASNEYYKSYKNHIKNIEDLEDMKGMTSLLSTFKNKVMKNDFRFKDSIDRSNPLLLRNYLVTDDSLPKNFKKEHVTNQIRYVISKFKPADKILIDSIGNLRIDGTTCFYTIKASNGDKHEKTTTINDDYLINSENVEEDVENIISELKSKLDFEIELVDEFEVGENRIEVPGLTFADPEEILQAKLREIKGSVKAETPVKASNNNENGNGNRNKHKAPKPNDRIIYSIGKKSSKHREKDSIERDIGVDAKLDPDQFKQEPQPEIAEQLKKIFNPDIQQPEQPQMQYQQPQYDQYGQVIPPSQGQQLPIQLQDSFPMQRTFDSPIIQPQPFYTVDPIEAKCRTMSNNPQACNADPNCYYSANLEPDKRCHKDLKKFTFNR